jgi:hypothetical protein
MMIEGNLHFRIRCRDAEIAEKALEQNDGAEE